MCLQGCGLPGDLDPAPAKTTAAAPAGLMMVSGGDSDARTQPAVACAADGSCLVAWLHTHPTTLNPQTDRLSPPPEIHGQRLAADGSKLGPELTLYVATQSLANDFNNANTITSLSLGMDAQGNFALCWFENHAQILGTGAYAQRYGADGSPRGDLLRVSLVTTVPQLAMAPDGRFAIAYGKSGVLWLRRYDAAADLKDGSMTLVESGAVFSPRPGSAPGIAMGDDGTALVAYDERREDSSICEMARHVGAQGQVGAPIELGCYVGGATDPLRWALSLRADGGFTAAWDAAQGQGGAITSIFRQRVGADGRTAGGMELAVPIGQGPWLTALPSGMTALMWSQGDAPTYYGSLQPTASVRLRMYGADGAPAGDDLTLRVPGVDINSSPSAAVSGADLFMAFVAGDPALDPRWAPVQPTAIYTLRMPLP